MRSIVLLLTLIASLVVTPAAQATYNYDKNAVTYDTMHFDTRDYALVCDSNGEVIGLPLTGADNIEKAFRYFVAQGLSPNASAGILGNLREESGVRPGAQQGGWSTSKFPSDGHGYGIAQWTYNDRQQPLVDLAEERNLANPADLGLQLDYIWIELNGKFKSALAAIDQPGITPSDAAFEFHKLYEISGDTRDQIKERLDSAEEVAAKYGPTVPNVADAGNTNSSSGCQVGALAGDVIGTATGGYVWPQPDCSQTVGTEVRKSCHDDYRKAYGPAMVHPGGEDAYTDCGTFVATVMRRSGADPDYPVVGTSVQMDYLKGQKDKKYTIIENPRQADVKPGDIVIYDGHTLLYVGAIGDNTNTVSAASLHQHTPQLETTGSLLDALNNHPGVIVARPL